MTIATYRSQGLLKKINEMCRDDKFIDKFEGLFVPTIYDKGNNPFSSIIKITELEDLFYKDLETLYNLCLIEYNCDSSKVRITQVGRDFARHLC